MKTLLFLTLILFAPVAGASTYRCATENEAITTHSEYDVARFIDKQGAFCRNMDIDQPAEEAKQSDAEKWKELCDKFIEAVREGVYDQTPVNHMKERLDFANLLCTRYTAALLEEMRNK